MLKKFPKRYLIYFYGKCRRGQIWSWPWSGKWPRRNAIISSCWPRITCIPALNSSWKPSMRVSKGVKRRSLANAISSKRVPRELIWAVRLSEASASFQPICEGWYASVVALTPSFDGLVSHLHFQKFLPLQPDFHFRHLRRTRCPKTHPPLKGGQPTSLPMNHFFSNKMHAPKWSCIICIKWFEFLPVDLILQIDIEVFDNLCDKHAIWEHWIFA